VLLTAVGTSVQLIFCGVGDECADGDPALTVALKVTDRVGHGLSVTQVLESPRFQVSVPRYSSGKMVPVRVLMAVALPGT